MAIATVRLSRLFPVACVAVIGSVGTLSADVLTPSFSCTLNGAAAPCTVVFPPPLTGAGVFWTDTGLGTPSIDVLVGAAAATDSGSGLTSASASITIGFGFMHYFSSNCRSMQRHANTRACHAWHAL